MTPKIGKLVMFVLYLPSAADLLVYGWQKEIH